MWHAACSQAAMCSLRQAQWHTAAAITRSNGSPPALDREDEARCHLATSKADYSHGMLRFHGRGAEGVAFTTSHLAKKNKKKKLQLSIKPPHEGVGLDPPKGGRIPLLEEGEAEAPTRGALGVGLSSGAARACRLHVRADFRRGAAVQSAHEGDVQRLSQARAAYTGVPDEIGL